MMMVMMFTIPDVSATTRTVNGPNIVSPKRFPVSPWENVTIMINITDYDSGTESVTLFYSANLSRPYNSTPMKLVAGDYMNGSFTAQIPRQPNGTWVYYYTEIVDRSGKPYTNGYDEKNPRRYEVIVFPSSFEIVYFGIENVDPRELTADIKVTFNIYRPLLGEEPASVTVQVNNEYWDWKTVEITLSPGKYLYSLQTDLKGFHLIGDASSYPFDRYYLDLNFTLLFNTERARFYPESIPLSPSSSHYIWEYVPKNFTDTGAQPGSRIRVHIDFSRRPENARYVIAALIAGFFILGATPMLESRRQLSVRVTIYLALFVFVLGFISTVNTLVPKQASGVSVAETALSWLGTYVAIFVVASVFANLLIRLYPSHPRAVSFTVDMLATLFILYLIFNFIVVKTPDFEKTLSSHIPSSPLAFQFKLLMIGGLLYGLIIRGASLVRQEPSDLGARLATDNKADWRDRRSS